MKYKQNHKKTIVILIIALLITIPSCSLNKGEIKEANVTKKEKSADDKPNYMFKPQENTFNINFKEYKTDLVSFSMPYPENFDIDVRSDTNIYMDYKDGDFLKNTSIRLLVDSGEIVELDTMADVIPLFEERLRMTRYNIEGKEYQEYILQGDPVDNNLPFTEDKEELIYRGAKDNVKLRNEFGYSPDNNYYCEKIYIHWDNDFPIVLSGVTPMENKETLSELLSFMVSNMQKTKKPELEYKKVSFKKQDTHKYLIPKNFSIKKEVTLGKSKKGFAYIVPTDKGNQLSGMSFSFYQYNNKDGKNLNWEDFNDNTLSFDLMLNGFNGDSYELIRNGSANNESKVVKTKTGNANTWTSYVVFSPENPKHIYGIQNDTQLVSYIYKIKTSSGYQLFALTFNTKQYKEAETISQKIVDNL